MPQYRLQTGKSAPVRVWLLPLSKMCRAARLRFVTCVPTILTSTPYCMPKYLNRAQWVAQICIGLERIRRREEGREPRSVLGLAITGGACAAQVLCYAG